MTRHKCGDHCPNSAKRGPKIKCCKCTNVCYLQCFDFEAGEKIDGQETVKLTVNNVVMTSFISTMGFSCCTNALTPKEQKAALKMPSVARNSSKSRTSNDNEQLVVNELSIMKELLSTIKKATDANTVEIAAIKSLTAQTDANVKKVSDQSAPMNQMATPRSPAMSYVNAFHARTYAKAAAQTPTGKRKRAESTERPKPKFPEPKLGTKSSATGLTIIPKPDRVRDDTPVFAKALYVSGLDPSTSNEQIAEYIVANTPVVEENKFKVYKLVKKGTDESTLKFVSFKIELNAEELEYLDNVDLWPQGVRVREFQVLPKNDLGRHFPSLSDTQAKGKPPTNSIDLTNDQMDTAH